MSLADTLAPILAVALFGGAFLIFVIALIFYVLIPKAREWATERRQKTQLTNAVLQNLRASQQFVNDLIIEYAGNAALNQALPNKLSDELLQLHSILSPKDKKKELPY